MAWLINIHIFTTLAMTGIIWFVQIVHYPLFQKVDSNNFVNYENAHTRLTAYVVMPLMLGELLSGFSLLLFDHAVTRNYVFYASLGLIVVNWFITFLLFVPMHRSLSQQFSWEISLRLISLNWLRTIIWSIRSISVLILFAHSSAP